MKLSFQLSDRTFSIDTAAPMDLAIALDFNGPQPAIYGVPGAASRAYEDGDFVGDTRRGGGCNFDEIRMVPHCNGTHTECVGHLSDARISVNSILRGGLIPATVVTLDDEDALSSSETYNPQKEKGDRLITAKNLFYALNNADKTFLKGLIIRTKPNDESKKSRNYEQHAAPYFSLEAINYIIDLDVAHLLVDLPSVDRKRDEGRLSVHHLYWGVMQGSHDVDPAACSLKTITEFIYVPDTIPDGRYMLDLQIPTFVSDAAPSRPLIYTVME